MMSRTAGRPGIILETSRGSASTRVASLNGAPDAASGSVQGPAARERPSRQPAGDRAGGGAFRTSPSRCDGGRCAGRPAP